MKAYGEELAEFKLEKQAPVEDIVPKHKKKSKKKKYIVEFRCLYKGHRTLIPTWRTWSSYATKKAAMQALKTLNRNAPTLQGVKYYGYRLKPEK